MDFHFFLPSSNVKKNLHHSPPPPPPKKNREEKKKKKFLKTKKKHLPSLPCPKAMVLLPRDMRPWLRDMRLCMWLNPMVIVLCPRDMRQRSRDMRPQLRDMITWFRDMRSCMCAVHSWAAMRSAAPGLGTEDHVATHD